MLPWDHSYDSSTCIYLKLLIIQLLVGGVHHVTDTEMNTETNFGKIYGEQTIKKPQPKVKQAKKFIRFNLVSMRIVPVWNSLPQIPKR